MKRIALLLIALTMLALLTGCADPAAEYNAATALLEAGQYAEAAAKFKALKDYEDASMMRTYCEACVMCESGDYTGGIVAFQLMFDFRDSRQRVGYYRLREEESLLAEDDWPQMRAVATRYDSLEGFQDAADRAASLRARADVVLDSGYDAASALLAEGRIPEAYRAFAALDGHKDSAEQLSAIRQRHPLAQFQAAEAGDIVILGQYWHTNKDNPMEPIEWLVLAREDGRVLLISRYILAARQFNLKLDNLKWDKSALRTWLNYTFINEAFTAREREMILPTDLAPAGNPETGATPGQTTQDKVFLLSIEEFHRYFTDAHRSASAEATVYASLGGLPASGSRHDPWWLRAPGRYATDAAYVDTDGSVVYDGQGLNYKLGVRPAMWIAVGE